MKPARTWSPVLAFLVLSVLASLPAHSAISCDRICDCGVLCSTHCGPPATTCGASGVSVLALRFVPTKSPRHRLGMPSPVSRRICSR